MRSASTSNIPFLATFQLWDLRSGNCIEQMVVQIRKRLVDTMQIYEVSGVYNSLEAATVVPFRITL